MQTSPNPPSFDQRAPVVGAPTADSGQYLTLRLGEEDYAIDIMRVQEIRSYEEPTRMANSPSFIKGVINLRGVIVPIVDLRMKLNVDKVDYTEFTVVIILKLKGAVTGAVVDAVSDVVTLDSKMIKPAPQFESAIDSRFILGLADVGERMLIVMNMEALLSNAEMGMAASGCCPDVLPPRIAPHSRAKTRLFSCGVSWPLVFRQCQVRPLVP